MDAELEKRLGAIGPFRVVRDADAELVVRWEGLAELASPLGTFGLEIRADAIGLVGRMWLDDRLFELWEAWKGRHAEYAAELHAAVELEMESAGVSGDPANHVTSLRVTIGRIDDGPSSVYYEVVARLQLTLGAGRCIVGKVDPDTGRIDLA